MTDKKIKARIKLLIPGGQATPAPPIGSNLAPYGVNLQEFCKQFNDKTRQRQGEIFRVIVSVYEDKTFNFQIKEAPVSFLLKQYAKIEKGSKDSSIVARITMDQVREIAKRKMKDFNTQDLEKAVKMILGTARSMGIEVVEK